MQVCTQWIDIDLAWCVGLNHLSIDMILLKTSDFGATSYVMNYELFALASHLTLAYFLSQEGCASCYENG